MPRRIGWYRSPVTREELISLNRRSDRKGLLQAGGYLGLLACTGSAAVLSLGRVPWPAVVALCFLHGMCASFTINGFHEMVHDSVFRTRSLNRLFLAVISFLGWHNPVGFWATHSRHHQYALHPPNDPEVMLPGRITLKRYIEHHMYAAVPCYHLGRLHRLVRQDLPHCPRGLVETWRQIAAIQKRQKTDPDYQFVAALPPPVSASS